MAGVSKQQQVKATTTGRDMSTNTPHLFIKIHRNYQYNNNYSMSFNGL